MSVKQGQTPVYLTEIGKQPVYPVNNLHIKKVNRSMTLYELQLNGEYYQISEDQIEAIESILRLPEGVGLAVG